MHLNLKKMLHQLWEAVCIIKIVCFVTYLDFSSYFLVGGGMGGMGGMGF
jgi:hypothetical protein